MEILPIVVGTAGHIDHGKSSLVRALTGIDPDRLKEEKERGLTIDLGFANLLLPDGRRLGLVDVPGHERFIKNMVAGATGIDLVLLVVAADDGVMPQTREHLWIMQLLGLQRGLIALTKIDTTSAEMVELAAEDVASEVRGTFLEAAPILPVSSVTGEGLEELRQQLIEMAQNTQPRSAEGLFRMPIQRVFSKPGFGTVVTGIPISGSASIGDALEVLPLGQLVKLRGLQAYGDKTDHVRAGHSSALNLSDLERTRVERGHVVATPGFFHPTTMIAARLESSAELKRAIRDRLAVRLHAGTDDPAGELVLLEGAALEPGDSQLVQIRLERPTVVAPGDRFILRLLSPEVTLGGGVVLEESRHRLKRGKEFVLSGLRRVENSLADLDQRILAELGRDDREPLQAQTLAERIKLPVEPLEARLGELLRQGRIVAAGRGPRYLESSAGERAQATLTALASRWFEAHPERQLIPKSELETTWKGTPAGFELALALALTNGLLESQPGGQYRRPGARKELDPRARQLLGELQVGGLTPKSLAELSSSPADEQRTRAQLDGLVDAGLAVRVAAGMYFSREAFDRAVAAVEQNCRRNGALAIPELREELGTTRKYLIPLLEHLDSIGMTLRQGAHRVLRRS